MPNYIAQCPMCNEKTVKVYTSYEYHGDMYQRPEELVDSITCTNGCDLEEVELDCDLEYEDADY